MTLAFIFVNTLPDEGNKAEKSVKEVKGVVESHYTSGAYDMILKVKADTEADLREIIGNIKKGCRHCGRNNKHSLQKRLFSHLAAEKIVFLFPHERL
ncbi:MAG: Lrp/AsnC ligand binding domain-containing protein [Nitrososphaera sp.]|jgi:DNA-binding Lrp family transcriptional regulator